MAIHSNISVLHQCKSSMESLECDNHQKNQQSMSDLIPLPFSLTVYLAKAAFLIKDSQNIKRLMK